MSKKVYYIIGAVVVLLGVIGFFVFKTPAQATTGNALVGTVKIGDIAKTVTATGVISQPQSYNLTFSGQGAKIAKVNVSVGDKVKAGDVLAQADLTTLNMQLTQAQTNLNSAKAKLDQVKSGATAADIASANAAVVGAQSALVKAQDTYNTTPNEVNKAALDSANANLVSAQAAFSAKQSAPTSYDLATSQAAYDQTVASYNIAKQNVADATLKAPIDGIIVAQNGKAGETVGQLPVVALESTRSDMQINSSIDETDISSVKVGQDVDVTLDSYPGKKLTGKVSLISPQAQTQSNVTFFNVVIAVTNQDDMLKTGMNANIAILVSNVKNVVTVPSEAIKGNDKFKFVLLANSGTAKPQRTRVEVGTDNGILTEIKSGLQDGDKVILGYTSGNSTSTSTSTSQQKSKSSSPFGGIGRGSKG